MADFPTTPHTFTPFANGALSDAAQVTDIYNEVEAIETGYLTGTARLNSSNSTVANLSVPGGSTFAGPVTFSTQVTLTAQPRCFLTRTSTLSINSGSATAINWDTEAVDVGGLHSTSVNSSAVTIPAGSSGTYLITASVQFNASSVGSRVLDILKNGALVTGGRVQHAPAPGSVATVLNSAVVEVCDAADVITVQVLQDSGSTLSLFNTLNGRFNVCRWY